MTPIAAAQVQLKDDPHSVTAERTQGPPPSADPHNNASSALNDITTLFQTAHTHGGHKESHVSHKLTFYAARVLATPSHVLHVLARELLDRADVVEREGIRVEVGQKTRKERSQLVIDDDPRRVAAGTPPSQAFIEELT